MTINKKPLSYYIEKYNKNNDNQDKRPIIDENKNLPLKPQVLNTEEINLNTFNKINEELLEVSAKLKIKKDNINVKSQSEDNSEITKTKKNKNLSHISKSSSPEKIKLEEKKQEADPFLDNIFINDKNCVADVNKIRGKIAFLVNQAENQEKKSEVIINLERIRSKLFWLSNSINNEKILSEILKLNDEINGTFEKLLTTPNPISKDKIEKIETKRDNDDDLCIICLEKKVSHACIPCGHLKYCEKCIQIIVERNECAVCRSKVQSVYKIFI